MSPAQKKDSHSPKSTPASEPTVDTHSPSEPPAADPIVEPVMDQSSSPPIAPEEQQLRPAPTPPKRPVERETVPLPPQSSAAPASSETEAAPVENVQPEPEVQAIDAAPAENSSPDASSALSDSLSLANRLQPIPPASEPMQYRAIGLVRGTYVPSEEQFTRGFIHTDDGVAVDAVLLGRVMSLVKKHLDLEQPHLWVVYPRTREKMNDLHVQIVGVWEPEKLKRSDMEGAADEEATGEETEETSEETSSSDASDTLEASVEASGDASGNSAPEPELEMVPASELDDKFFSIRGEIIYQSPEEERLMVKIRRIARPGDTQDKAFKVALKGTLEGKAVGYFWDLQVQRQENDLIVQQGTMIALVPPQKRQGGFKKPQGRFRRPGPGGPGGPGGRRPSGPPRKWNAGGREGGAPRPQFKSGDRPTPPPQPRTEVTKPIKRRPPESAPPASQE